MPPLAARTRPAAVGLLCSVVWTRRGVGRGEDIPGHAGRNNETPRVTIEEAGHTIIARLTQANASPARRVPKLAAGEPERGASPARLQALTVGLKAYLVVAEGVRIRRLTGKNISQTAETNLRGGRSATRASARPYENSWRTATSARGRCSRSGYTRPSGAPTPTSLCPNTRPGPSRYRPRSS